MPYPRLSPVANRKTLVQRIISEIQDRLVKGALRAGDRLPPEGKLAAQFGVGRTSVREAMKVLAALGVIEIRRGDGTYVSESMSARIFDRLLFQLLLSDTDKKKAEPQQTGQNPETSKENPNAKA